MFTIDQAVEKMGFGRFQIKLSLLTGLAWVDKLLYIPFSLIEKNKILINKIKMADAMEMMILSILAPALHCDWLLNEWQKALITTVVF